jgi:hypothetical protein
MIFQLEWTTYDSAIIHHFEAPEGATLEQFQALCDKLMEESLQDAVEGKPGRSPMHENPPYWLGYMYGVEEVAARLADHGYKEVKFATVNYTHGSIIDGKKPEEGCEDFGYGKTLTGDTREKVAAYNQKMSEDNKERRQRKS